MFHIILLNLFFYKHVYLNTLKLLYNITGMKKNNKNNYSIMCNEDTRYYFDVISLFYTSFSLTI